MFIKLQHDIIFWVAIVIDLAMILDAGTEHVR